MSNIDTLINFAKNEVGYLEKSKSAYTKNPNVLYDKTAGAGYDNYTKYGYEMHKIYPAVMDFPAAWCDCFVDWCFYKVFGVATAKSLLCGDFNDYTVASADMYKKKGAWYTSNPKPGDQIFFKNKTGICHTGLVRAVDKNYVYTIEGNTSSSSGVVANGGGVFEKKYPIRSANIAGYGRPKYDLVSNLEEITEVTNITPGTPISSGGTITPISDMKVALPTLKKGDKGTQVKYLQQNLNALGAKIQVNGIFEDNTLAWLKFFQKVQGLVQDGIYGQASYKRMCELIK